ncbi:hypothetical protein [Hyphobacterium indicum]|uniref:hypothetical protein n=1 Tax=Hyphobacterium indicum TaxID=2162714 RepID=UPI000D65A35C|nr:hypothetical protein [Hyphobacterium indicum]
MKSSLMLAALGSLALTGAASALSDTEGQTDRSEAASDPQPAVAAEAVDKPVIPADGTPAGKPVEAAELAAMDGMTEAGPKPDADG